MNIKIGFDYLQYLINYYHRISYLSWSIFWFYLSATDEICIIIKSIDQKRTDIRISSDQLYQLILQSTNKYKILLQNSNRK